MLHLVNIVICFRVLLNLDNAKDTLEKETVNDEFIDKVVAVIAQDDDQMHSYHCSLSFWSTKVSSIEVTAAASLSSSNASLASPRACATFRGTCGYPLCKEDKNCSHLQLNVCSGNARAHVATATYLAVHCGSRNQPYLSVVMFRHSI